MRGNFDGILFGIEIYSFGLRVGFMLLAMNFALLYFGKKIPIVYLKLPLLFFIIIVLNETIK